MAKLADGNRLSDHLRERFAGANREEALESVKDVKALTRNHPELAEVLVEDAGRRQLSVEKARESIVVPWITENLKSSGRGGKKAAAGKGKPQDDAGEADAGDDGAPPPAGGNG